MYEGGSDGDLDLSRKYSRKNFGLCFGHDVVVLKFLEVHPPPHTHNDFFGSNLYLFRRNSSITFLWGIQPQRLSCICVFYRLHLSNYRIARVCECSCTFSVSHKHRLVSVTPSLLPGTENCFTTISLHWPEPSLYSVLWGDTANDTHMTGLVFTQRVSEYSLNTNPHWIQRLRLK